MVLQRRLGVGQGISVTGAWLTSASLISPRATAARAYAIGPLCDDGNVAPCPRSVTAVTRDLALDKSERARCLAAGE